MEERVGRGVEHEGRTCGDEQTTLLPVFEKRATCAPPFLAVLFSLLFLALRTQDMELNKQTKFAWICSAKP